MVTKLSPNIFLGTKISQFILNIRGQPHDRNFFFREWQEIDNIPSKKEIDRTTNISFFFSLKKKKTNVSLKKFKMKFTLSYRRETTFAFEIY